MNKVDISLYGYSAEFSEILKQQKKKNARIRIS